jgi:predicted nucleic-acid-binding protein
MEVYCIDTNYILRFLLNDVESQANLVEQLFHSASEGEVKCFISVIVQMEIIYVLSSFYDQNKQNIYEKMQGLYSLSFLDFESAQLMKQSLGIYLNSNVSVQDAYLICLSKLRNMNLTTFDKKAYKVFKETT